LLIVSIAGRGIVSQPVRDQANYYAILSTIIVGQPLNSIGEIRKVSKPIWKLFALD